MLIIAGPVYVDARLRDACVAAMKDLVRRARAHPGCLDVVVAADPLEPDRINNFELWESEETLRSWRAMANAPTLPAEIERDEVAKYQIGGVGSPFD